MIQEILSVLLIEDYAQELALKGPLHLNGRRNGGS